MSGWSHCLVKITFHFWYEKIAWRSDSGVSNATELSSQEGFSDFTLVKNKGGVMGEDPMEKVVGLHLRVAFLVYLL